MRLIDADALGVTDFEIALCGGDYKELCKTLIAKVESAPAIDAVPVVRCFYCKHWKEPRSAKTIPWCNHLKTVMHASDFCNYGKRREDGDA